VASTPTVRVRVCSAAGFTAGSMPTNGVDGKARRMSCSAAADAVLHATTISFAPWPIRKRAMPIENRRTSASGRGP
jgi:hypothetical protein